MATNGLVRKRIAFEADMHPALHKIAIDRAATLQELAEEASAMLLKKYNRPVTLQEMLTQSVRMAPVNDREVSKTRRNNKSGPPT